MMKNLTNYCFFGIAIKKCKFYELKQFFLFLCFIHLHAHAQFEFDGQILAQTNIGLEEQSSKFLGTRYLPSLTFKKKRIA